MAGKYGPIKQRQGVILYHPKVGFVRGTAKQDWSWEAGGLARFDAYINSDILPGVQEMQINTNIWEVYADDDPEILKKISREYVKPYMTR